MCYSYGVCRVTVGLARNSAPAESLMIVDEADELLRGNGGFFSIFGFDMSGKSTEKGVMNGILDGMKVPAIWICNASCVENYAKDFVGSESPDRPRMNILLWVLQAPGRPNSSST